MTGISTEGRLLLIGVLLSGAAGVIIGMITENPLLSIAAGMVSALVVQRLREGSTEDKSQDDVEKSPE
jgi:hypothetical protein